MTRNMTDRGLMAALGALAGFAFYGLSEIVTQDVLSDRMALWLSCVMSAFFFALLGLAGALRLARSAALAAVLALGVAGLMVIASLRFATVEAMFGAPIPVLAAMILMTIPLPFFIAASGPGWRDYPTLFTQSWTILVRYAAAGLFTMVAWGVIFLSGALLSIVGVPLIDWLLEIGPVPWVITGTVLGLAMAVVTELSDLVSPYLVLRLIRLLLPVVLVVMLVFVLALPVQGLSGLLGGLSVAATLLAMAGIAASLVTVAVDQTDEEGVQGPWMEYAAQALALLVPVFALLAGWAVWLRIDQYGLTPERVFAGLAAAVCAGYGLAYVWAVLGRAVWRGRVRTANRSMALVLMGVAAAWLSVLNAQSISAHNQVARYVAGRTAPAGLDLRALADWGHAGTRARAELDVIAATDTALAARLAEVPADPADPADRADGIAAKRDALAAILPVRPDTRTAATADLLAAIPDWLLDEVLAACRRPMDNGQPGCVLVVADFWPDREGEEAMLLRLIDGNLLQMDGIAGFAGSLQIQPVVNRNRQTLDGPAIVQVAQNGALTLTPVPQQMLTLGGAELMLQP